jgi:hypothetical protein
LGFPIRISPDYRLLASPRGFSQLATSFFAYLRQGIHTHALSSLTIKFTLRTTSANLFRDQPGRLSPYSLRLPGFQSPVRFYETNPSPLPRGRGSDPFLRNEPPSSAGRRRCCLTGALLVPHPLRSPRLPGNYETNPIRTGTRNSCFLQLVVARHFLFNCQRTLKSRRLLAFSLQHLAFSSLADS